MKQFITLFCSGIKKALLFLMVFCTVQQKGFSQMAPVNEPDETMPTLFDNSPDTVNANIGMLSAVFNQPVGQRIRIQLSDRFSIDGVLAAVAGKPDEALQTFRLIPENFQGTSFVFSRTTGRTGEAIYRGYLTGRHVQDCYQLVKENNRYYFIKKNINSLRAE